MGGEPGLFSGDRSRSLGALTGVGLAARVRGLLEDGAQLRRRPQDADKVLARQDEEQARRARAHGGGAGNVVDERDLTEEVAVLQHAKQAGAAVPRRLED